MGTEPWTRNGLVRAVATERDRLGKDVVMSIPNFREMREQIAAIRAVKNETFPIGSIVSVDNERFHGLGIVSRDETCPLDKLAVRVESLNVWWYPTEDCQPYSGRMPSWMRGYMQSHKIRRTQATTSA